jgi:hypothetical protein
MEVISISPTLPSSIARLAVVYSEFFCIRIPEREAKAFAIGIIYTNSRDEDDYRNMIEALT